MPGWLRRWRQRDAAQPAPLTGAPAVRRLKTYSAQSGYVYQYVYEGRRAVEQGAEYVFSVSADRAKYNDVSVFVLADAVAAWESAHGRALSETERYGIAKLALRQAFDDREHPAQMRHAVNVRAADLEGIAEVLGLE